MQHRFVYILILISSLSAPTVARAEVRNCLKRLTTVASQRVGSAVARLTHPSSPTDAELDVAATEVDLQLAKFRGMPHDLDKFLYALAEVDRLRKTLPNDWTENDRAARARRLVLYGVLREYEGFATRAFYWRSHAYDFAPIYIPEPYVQRALLILEPD